VEVSDLDASADAGTMLSLIVGRGEHAIATWPLSATELAPALTLPVPVETVRLVSSGPLGTTRVRLRRLTGPSRNTNTQPRANYAVRSEDALLFIFDVPQPEDGGFWVFADRPVAVVCSRIDGERPCAGLRFETGAEAATVAMTHGTSTQQLNVGARSRVERHLQASFEPVRIVASGPPSRSPAVFVTAVSQDAPR
jgi:hypothetical protein